MLFYWVIFIIVFFCAFGKTPQKRKLKFLLSAGLLCIIGCTRAMSVGMDVTGYCNTYLELNSATYSVLLEKFEPGFLMSMSSFKYFGIKDPMLYIYFCFIVFWLCNLNFIKKYTDYSGFAVFLIYSMGYYFGAFNTVRQMLCHAIILCFIPLLQQQKYKKYIILTIVTALLFHKSQVAMLLCLFPFVAPIRLQKEFFLYLYLIGSIILAIFILPKLSAALTILSLYVNNSTYSGYLMDTTTLGDLSISNLAMHSLYIAIVVYFSSRSNISSISKKFLVISVLGQALSNLLSPVSWILARVTDSLTYFRIVPISELFFNKKTRNRWIFQLITLAYFIVRFYGRLKRDGVGDDGDVIPYVSIFANLF